MSAVRGLVARLTVAQVAEVAQRHPVTVRKALEDGRLHGTQLKVRGPWRVREDCLDAWLDGDLCQHQRDTRNVRDLRSRTRSA